MPAGALLVRHGGDEFACLLPFAPNAPDTVQAVADDMLSRIGHGVAIEGVDSPVTVSIGIAPSTLIVQADPVSDAARLLHLADIAMYHAKRQGRNRSQWFEPAMEQALTERRALEAGIRAGLAAGEFEPYYEQQIDISTGKICGFEMLARWNSPQGLIGPDVFIPVSEEIGVIGALSEKLIAQALRDARDWSPELTLSVNISPVQLRDPWFSQRLLRMLVNEGFPPSRLDIEITESCLHDNLASVEAQVTSLRNQGISISLDDFGTGYSSLAQLRALPFNRIKIDRSFVTSMHANADSATIVRSITSLGAGLGLPITAEGIENEEISSRLTALGRFTGQGYLYGQPEPAHVVRAQLAARGLLAPGQGEPANPTDTASRRSA